MKESDMASFVKEPTRSLEWTDEKKKEFGIKRKGEKEAPDGQKNIS